MRLPSVGSLAFALLVAAACGDAEAPPATTPDAAVAPTPTPPRLTVLALASRTALEGRAPSRGLFLLAQARVEVAADAVDPVPVPAAQFSLALGDDTVLLPSPLPVMDGCPADRLLGPGGSLSCVLAFDVSPDAVLRELRFRDPTIGEVVSAATPSAMVPAPFVSGQREIGQLRQLELDAVCGEGGGPTPGSAQDCPFQGGTSTVRAAGGQTCGQRQMPAVVDEGQACFRFESVRCTVAGFRACRAELASDLCALTDIDSPCACGLPIVEPDPMSCP